MLYETFDCLKEAHEQDYFTQRELMMRIME